MNTLYGLPAGAGLRQGSPWVMKVQLAMRCLKIDYDLKQRNMMQVWTRAPEGKVPWLVIDGQTISGSERILRELENTLMERNFLFQKLATMPRAYFIAGL